MFKKSALAVLTVIGMFCFSVPAMAETDTPIIPMEKTMYTTADLLNIRDIPSTDGEIIGASYYGDSVKVTGMTEQNGEEFGWFRIVLDDKEGFVTAEFLTEAAPAAAGYTDGAVQAIAGQTNAGQAIAVPAGAAPGSAGQNIIKSSYVYAKDGSLVAIFKNADGSWHDSNGTNVTWVTDIQATTAGGQALTSFNPLTGPTAGSYPLAEGFFVDDAYGNCQGRITPYSDGNYYSNDMRLYEDNGDGSYYGAGETVYSDPYESDAYGLL